MEFYRSYHGVTAPSDLSRAVEATTKAVNAFRVEHPSITHLVATGTSGQAVAWPVSARLNIPVVVVRKPADQGHAGQFVGEGDLGDYVIIDDFIATGRTIRNIVGGIDAEYAKRLERGGMGGIKPKPLAIFLYNDWSPEQGSFELPDGTQLPKFSLKD